MTQAVPSANGPDLYVEETCPEGTMVRALTADGRELWRRLLGGPAAAPPNAAAPIGKGPYIGFFPNGSTSKAPGKPDEPTGERINSHARSVCDAITVGMSRDDVSKAVSQRNAALDPRQRSTDTWLIEEEGFRCTISFDANDGRRGQKEEDHRHRLARNPTRCPPIRTEPPILVSHLQLSLPQNCASCAA